MILYLTILAIKIAAWAVIAAILGAAVLAVIPVEIKFSAQNRDDEKDNFKFSISWLFSGINLFVTADVAGVYEVGLVLFGWRLFKKREIFIDEESL